jgi:hypothetical protein
MELPQRSANPAHRVAFEKPEPMRVVAVDTTIADTVGPR